MALRILLLSIAKSGLDELHYDFAMLLML